MDVHPKSYDTPSVDGAVFKPRHAGRRKTNSNATATAATIAPNQMTAVKPSKSATMPAPRLPIKPPNAPPAYRKPLASPGGIGENRIPMAGVGDLVIAGLRYASSMN